MCRRQSMSLQMRPAYHFNADTVSMSLNPDTHMVGSYITRIWQIANIYFAFKQWHMFVEARNTDLIKLHSGPQSKFESYVNEYSFIMREA